MLIDLLPDYYKNSPQVVLWQSALQEEAQDLRGARDELLKQLNVTSATWGLSLWEAALGIVPDASKTDEYRRTRITSKLRGQGTTTAGMIKNVAESFSNGEAEVIEHSGAYSFDIKFTGTIGVPPNMDDLTAAVEEIKPAHLAYTFIYLFRMYQELRSKTYGQLEAFTYTQLREGELT